MNPRPVLIEFRPLTPLTLCTTGDLEGLKVSHDFTEMGEGEARVLTLKDSRILDDEGLFRLSGSETPLTSI